MGELRRIRRKDAVPISDTAPCVGCALCCDGTINAMAEARPDEEEALKSAGLSIFESGGKQWFALPCRFSEQGRCTIYDQRFKVCRVWRCKLLESYQAGETSRDEALRRVKVTVGLRAAVAQDEERAVLWTERQKLRVELESSNERPVLKLNMAALDYCIDRWFKTLPANKPANPR